jgi:hypothetical protein
MSWLERFYQQLLYWVFWGTCLPLNFLTWNIGTATLSCGCVVNFQTAHLNMNFDFVVIVTRMAFKC